MRARRRWAKKFAHSESIRAMDRVSSGLSAGRKKTPDEVSPILSRRTDQGEAGAAEAPRFTAGLRRVDQRDVRRLRERVDRFFAPLFTLLRDRDEDRDEDLDDDDRLPLADLRDRLPDDFRVRLADERLPPLAFRPPLDFRPFEDFVSPDCARCLLTVRAAISSARSSPTPRSSSESLMCSYCRFRFGFVTPRGGIPRPPFSACGTDPLTRARTRPRCVRLARPP
jgi:hypothetical protein